jgi:predicted RNA-binding protein with PIN domain
VASGDVPSPADVELTEFDVVIVDGFNALGSRPDGWWRDRPAAMERLVASLAELAGGLGNDVSLEVWFDGRPHDAVAAAAEGAGVRVDFAGSGRDAADRRIAARVRELNEADPAPAVLVVSSDRRLAAAVKAAGGRSVGAGGFLKRFVPDDAG